MKRTAKAMASMVRDNESDRSGATSVVRRDTASVRAVPMPADRLGTVGDFSIALATPRS
jgi:hypothetical protein